jgi:hypothetical protein
MRIKWHENAHPYLKGVRGVLSSIHFLKLSKKSLKIPIVDFFLYIPMSQKQIRYFFVSSRLRTSTANFADSKACLKSFTMFSNLLEQSSSTQANLIAGVPSSFAVQYEFQLMTKNFGYF